MTLWAICLLALALSMDALAVSIGTGSCRPPYPLRDRLSLALSFGLFQGIMPLIGYSIGKFGAALLGHLDHWIAFIILAGIGGKMIYEGLSNRASVECPAENPGIPRLSLRRLLILSVATSLDAAAVGISLALLNTPILHIALIIAVITGFISWIGTEFGSFLGRTLGSSAEILGGFILLFIGLKILLSHLTA